MQNVAIYLAACASIATVLGIIHNTFKIREIHVLINSRLTELLALTRTSAKAEGVKEGQETTK